MLSVVFVLDRVGDPDGVLGSSSSRSASELRIVAGLPSDPIPDPVSPKERSTSSLTSSKMCSPVLPSPLARFARRGEMTHESFAAASVH